MKSNSKKKLMGKKNLESSFHKKGSTVTPEDLLIRNSRKIFNSSFELEEDDETLEIEDYFELNENLLNITIQTSQRNNFNFNNI
jgi:hypothetical protein